MALMTVHFRINNLISQFFVQSSQTVTMCSLQCLTLLMPTFYEVLILNIRGTSIFPGEHI